VSQALIEEIGQYGFTCTRQGKKIRKKKLENKKSAQSGLAWGFHEPRLE
jgi:hypothetical protein